MNYYESPLWTGFCGNTAIVWHVLYGRESRMVIQDDPFKVEGAKIAPSVPAIYGSNADIANKAIAKPGGFSELTHEDFLSVVRTANYVNAPAPVIVPVYDAATDTTAVAQSLMGKVAADVFHQALLESALNSAAEKIPAPRPRCEVDKFSAARSEIGNLPRGDIAMRYPGHESRLVAEFNICTGRSEIDYWTWKELCGYVEHLHDRIAELENAPAAVSEPKSSASLSLQHAMSACTLLDAYGR